MSDLQQNYTDEQTGIAYTLVGDYYYPDIALPEEARYTIGRFGRERLDYLKNYRKVAYLNLLTSGKLNSHLHEIDETSNDRIDLICKQMAELEGVTEKVKADNPLSWIQQMNNIRNRAIEIIRNELIYK